MKELYFLKNARQFSLGILWFVLGRFLVDFFSLVGWFGCVFCCLWGFSVVFPPSPLSCLPWHENTGLSNVIIVSKLLHTVLLEAPDSLHRSH